MAADGNGYTSPTEEAALDFTTFQNVINGKLTNTEKTRHGINPSTLDSNPEVPISTQDDLDDAVQAARAASELWAEVPISERQESVIKFADALQSEKKAFAEMLVKEQGKPLPMAFGEVDNAVRWLKVQAGLKFPEHQIEDTEEKSVVTEYTPIGVAVGIVPWNYPLMLACGKIAPALISGNAMIINPSPFTPYCGLKLVELGQRFFPPGVLQALSGDDNLGPWLTAHRGIDKVSFTGSTHTGKLVMQSCAKTLKRVTLELGGKDPAMICADVDIKSIAPKAHVSLEPELQIPVCLHYQIAQLAWLNSGQICIAIKRIYIHSSIYKEFLAELVEATKPLLVGDGFKENVFLGPIQNAMQYERVKGFLDDVKKQNQTVAIGGAADAASGKGYFIQPTIVDNPPDSSRIVVEEPFGPVLPVMEWTDESEVIKRANDTAMGLGASVWSKNIENASKIARKIKAGNIWINTHMEIQPDASFGGHKQSGIGAEWGSEGSRSYCNTRTMYIRKK